MLESLRNSLLGTRVQQDRNARCRQPARSGRGSAFLRSGAILASTLGLCLLLPFASVLCWREPSFARPSGVIRSQSPDAAPPSQREQPPTIEVEPGPPLTKKQKQQLLKSNFERMRRDADELAELAKSLQQDLDKTNENVLSLKIVERAEKIEKLARKIKTAARGQ
jgi:hypothetical protein